LQQRLQPTLSSAAEPLLTDQHSSPPLAAADGFHNHSSWQLRSRLGVSAHVVGFESINASGSAKYQKRFQAVSVEACIARRPAYYVSNVVLPLSLISLLAACQFGVAIDSDAWFNRVIFAGTHAPPHHHPLAISSPSHHHT
jgi:hypothetical protein